MSMRTVAPEDVKFMEHGHEYATAKGPITHTDPIQNLKTLRSWMVMKRRATVLDAMQYPQACIGRGLDVMKLQPLIAALDEAIADEEALLAAEK